MRTTIIGIVIGVVIGVVLGATVVAPRLIPTQGPGAVRSAGGEADETSAALPLSATSPGLVAVRWRLASAYGAKVPHFGAIAAHIEREVWRVSGGSTEIKLEDAGAIDDPAKIIDAVATGTVQAGLGAPDLWRAKNAALDLFAAVPFGPSAREYMAWYGVGGGKELTQDIYQKLGVHGMPCGVVGPAAGGWFRSRITTVEDLADLPVRVDGLAGKILGRIGVETVPLPDQEVFLALESGAVDGAFSSLPSVDGLLDYRKLVKNYYFPGWHRPMTRIDLIVNLDRWRGLSATRRAQIEAVCAAGVIKALSESDVGQFEPLKDLAAQGVLVQRWPRETLTALEAAWQEIAAETAAAEPDFRHVWDSLTEFRKRYSIWAELGRP